MDLCELTISQAKEGLVQRKFSSVELVKSCLARIKKLEPKLNAFVTICDELALEEAKQADVLIGRGDDKPLLGIPVAVKDNFCTKGIRTTASSKVLDDFIPPYNATVVEKLKNVGAITLGKTNCDAWAHGSSGENSDFGPAKNPWNTEYIPGGSSSGSAVSLAVNQCLASTGTDTGGSIRLPASFCNLVGLKPTYGRVSRYGIVAMTSSVDSVGHFTKTVEDSALFLNVTAGKDVFDATTLEIGVPDYTKNLGRDIKGLKIGLPKEFFTEGLDARVEKLVKDALKILSNQGAEIIEISLPHTEYAIACYYIIIPAEISSNLARFDGVRYGNNRSFFGDEAKRRIMLGTFTLSYGYYDAYYQKAMQVRTLIKKDFDQAWERLDCIVTPVSPTLPWKLGEKVNDPLKMYLSDIFTVTANLAGIPGLSVPVGFIEELPVGMQILGPQFSEALLFQVAYAYEQASGWYKRKPKL